MNIFQKFFNNKKGSQLVEKILMVAFAVAGGGAVITYGVGVINASKTTEISLDGDVVKNSLGLSFIPGHKYRFTSEPSSSTIHASEDNDMEYFLISHVWLPNGQEKIITGTGPELNGKPYYGFLGYNCYCIDWDQNPSPFYLSTADAEGACLSFDFSEVSYKELTGRDRYSSVTGYYPRLNESGFWDAFHMSGLTIEYSGQYVRQGNGLHLLDYLEEVE